MKTVGVVICVILGIAAFPFVLSAYFNYIFWVETLLFGG